MRLAMRRRLAGERHRQVGSAGPNPKESAYPRRQSTPKRRRKRSERLFRAFRQIRTLHPKTLVSALHRRQGVESGRRPGCGQAHRRGCVSTNVRPRLLAAERTPCIPPQARPPRCAPPAPSGGTGAKTLGKFCSDRRRGTTPQPATQHKHAPTTPRPAPNNKPVLLDQSADLYFTYFTGLRDAGAPDTHTHIPGSPPATSPEPAQATDPHARAHGPQHVHARAAGRGVQAKPVPASTALRKPI